MKAEPAPGPVYLDNAATSYPKPPEVIAAVRACLDQSLTVQRSTHIAPFRGDEVLRRCRAKLARLLGASAPEEIVYAYSATDALNIAIHGLVARTSLVGRPFLAASSPLAGMPAPPGEQPPHILVSPLEHHSVMRPLHELRRTRGVEFEALPADAMGVVDPDAIRRLARPNTCAVIINWVSNVSGTVQPAAAIGAVCRELGIPYLVDASQAAGSHPVDVQAIGCDAMAMPAHKALFSLPGLGVLYVRRGLDLPPWRSGGTGYRSDLLEQPEEMPMRLESGTPNVPAIVGLDAALDWFARVGVEAIEAHNDALIAQLWDELVAIEGVELVGPGPVKTSVERVAQASAPVWDSEPDGTGLAPASVLQSPHPAQPQRAVPPRLARGHVVSFNLAGADPLVVAQVLAENYGISSRAGLHCAPTAHRHFGTYARGGTVRLSVSWFTSAEMAEYAVSAVREVATHLT